MILEVGLPGKLASTTFDVAHKCFGFAGLRFKDGNLLLGPCSHVHSQICKGKFTNTTHTLYLATCHYDKSSISFYGQATELHWKIKTDVRTKSSQMSWHLQYASLSLSLSLLCVCVCVCYHMLLLTCFSYNYNLFKTIFLFFFVYLNSFVHSCVSDTDGMFQSKLPP